MTRQRAFSGKLLGILPLIIGPSHTAHSPRDLGQPFTAASSLVAAVFGDRVLQSSHTGVPQSRGGVGDAPIGLRQCGNAFAGAVRVSRRPRELFRGRETAGHETAAGYLEHRAKSERAALLGCAEEVAVGVGEQAGYRSRVVEIVEADQGGWCACIAARG